MVGLLNFIGEFGDDAEDRSLKNQRLSVVRGTTAVRLLFFADILIFRALSVCVWIRVLRIGLDYRGVEPERRFVVGRSMWRERPCLEPGREVNADTPVSYRPERPCRKSPTRRLRVLYEDEYVLVVDKPAGVLTQPTSDAYTRHAFGTSAGRYLIRSRRARRPYIGIVHRIDRDTSGAVLLVCSSAALRPFQASFRAHAIERSYVAVCEGGYCAGPGNH